MALAIALLVVAAAYVATVPLGGAPVASLGPGSGALALGSAGPGPGIGQPAPDFVGADGVTTLLTDLNGEPIRLADFAGKPLWIVFWATWCTPCQQEASDIQAAYHAHLGSGLAVLAIDVQEPAASVRAFMQGRELDYAIGLDATAGIKASYGGLPLPSHVFVDGAGTIRDRYLGQLIPELMDAKIRSIIGS
jgi:peroxiredoxin